MPKRTSKADDDTTDPPEVIQKRRIVKVSGRFRRANGSPAVTTPPFPSSLFGAPVVKAPVPGPSLFGAPAVNAPSPAPSLFGAPAVNAPSPAPSLFGAPAVNAPIPGQANTSSLFGGTAVGAQRPSVLPGEAFSFAAGAPASLSSAGGVFEGLPPSTLSGNLFAAPAGGVFGGGNLFAAPSGSSFLGNAASSTTGAVPTPLATGAAGGILFGNSWLPSKDDATSTTATVTIPPSTTIDKTTAVAGAEQPLSALGGPSVAADVSPQPVAIMVEANAVGQPASRRHADNENTSLSTRSGAPFGSGPTAAQGIRLNKMFASWISHQIATDSASTLDVGLLDYVAFAAEIRNRADFSRADAKSTAGTAFKHPSAPSVFTLAAGLDPGPPVAPTVAAIPPVAPLAPAPTMAPAPAPAPSRAPVVTSTPTFSFSAPSTLPAAPGGAFFSFGAPSVSTSATPSATPAIIAPSTTSPTGGFKLDLGKIGVAGVASPPPFNGFQVPAGGAVALPAPAVADSEEDGMPKEDPSKLERAPGEENEEIMGNFRAKLYRFKKDEKAWGDMGVGLLRLMKHTTNDARRLVLRNDMGKVLLNTALYKGMKVTKTENVIKFVASIAEDGPTSIMIKVTAAELPELHAKVEGLLPSS